MTPSSLPNVSRIFGLAITTAVMLLWPMAVRASIVQYDFHTTSTTGGLPLSYAPVLKVDSSVLATGLSFTSTCSIPAPRFCSVTGSEAGFLSLSDATLVDFFFSVSLAFNGDGTLSGSITDLGLNQDLRESGSGLNLSGTLLSDAFLICGVQNVCSFEGFWLQTGATIPEPTSLALFGAALAGCGLLRRRCRKNA